MSIEASIENLVSMAGPEDGPPDPEGVTVSQDPTPDLEGTDDEPCTGSTCDCS